MTFTRQPARRFITRLICSCVAAFICVALAPSVAAQQQKARARELGLPFEGRTGTHNAITDVAGVEVGHTTLIAGSGRLVRGQGPVRTGVTAILPRGKKSFDPVFAATVQATEEAVTNAMLAAETITGADNVRAEAIPHERLREIMRKYNRLPPPGGK
jgi:hypothetical protein